MPRPDPFKARAALTTPHGSYAYFDLNALSRAGVGHVGRLPFSIKVLLESMLRNLDGFIVTTDHVAGLANWNAPSPAKDEIPFMPGRVVLQDFTGVPCVVDLAAMREAMQRLGGDPRLINPLVPCDLVIDHSVQVDSFGSKVSLSINAQKEFERNNERYEFLKWGQQSLSNFSVVPPATGIVHQVNLEYIAKVVLGGAAPQSSANAANLPVVYPDSCVGTDSHTTMINGLGVVGWGVGGIEAEAVMLGQPIYMLTPEVVGFRLKGRLPEGATATDLVLTVTEILRAKGVVDKFVEFCGEGLAALSVPDRATIANMAPEYGATMGFFPVDAVTLDYLRFTGRDEATVALVEAYCRANGLFWQPGIAEPDFTALIELDLSTVQPSLAGPRRPQDRVQLSQMKSMWLKELVDTFGKPTNPELINVDRWADEGGESGRVKAPGQTMPAVNVATAGIGDQATRAPSAHGGLAGSGGAVIPNRPGVPCFHEDRKFRLYNGDVVIAAITSCTNTSNPDVLIAAGLLARNARRRGLNRQPWVKTSLAPGSKVVTAYLDKAGLSADLDALGFQTVGYGCTTCIGNSGPLPDPISAAIKAGDLVACSVLSGNRNFEGRISPDVKANYLASPPLVVAYAIAGTVDWDPLTEPIGNSPDGSPVFLKDLWPSLAEIQAVKAACVTPDQFRRQYADVFTGNETWNRVPVSKSDLFNWDPASTYIQNPPFFEDMGESPAALRPITGARCLVYVGDSVTTDHISPAGDIAENSPAGEYLKSLGVRKADFNSYGSRRGNDRVMTRGTFANVRVKNKLALEPATGKVREGGWTRDFSRVARFSEPGVSASSSSSSSPASRLGDPGASASSSPPSSRLGEPGYPIDWIYNAAVHYRAEGTPLIVLAGKDYGMGSSRDWAAKGTLLLGVRAVIAQSFERIHRSNLVGMGVLPLCFENGQSAPQLGLTGEEVFDILLPMSPAGLVEPRCEVVIAATRADGSRLEFLTRCRIDTPVEAEYYRNGGVLQTVLRRLLAQSPRPAVVG